MFEEKNIFITGGTGFIMSHVVEKLADMGKNIVLFDNLQEHDMYEEMKPLLAKDNVRFIQGDIRDKTAVEEAMKGAEVVYHFAAVMGTSARFKLEIPTVEVNVIGTLNVLSAALDNNVKYFINPSRPPLTQWLTPYIISKIAQTQFTQLYHRTYGLPVVSLNIANCYGPRERSVLKANTFKPREGKKLIATCITAALKNEPLPIFGDGEQASDFVFIEDVVDACLKAVRKPAIGKTLDIGTGISTTVNRVAELIIELTGSKSQIQYLPMRTGEVKLSTVSDPADAKRYLDWEPRTGLREGIRKTIPYYAGLLGIKQRENQDLLH